MPFLFTDFKYRVFKDQLWLLNSRLQILRSLVHQNQDVDFDSDTGDNHFMLLVIKIASTFPKNHNGSKFLHFLLFNLGIFWKLILLDFIFLGLFSTLRHEITLYQPNIMYQMHIWAKLMFGFAFEKWLGAKIVLNLEKCKIVIVQPKSNTWHNLMP